VISNLYVVTVEDCFLLGERCSNGKGKVSKFSLQFTVLTALVVAG